MAKPEETRLRRSPPEAADARQRRPRCGEVAAGTAAGCAAVCCCVPFAVLELVVLAAVRAPAALCRRTVRHRRSRRRAARARRVKEMEDLILAGSASPRSVAVAAEQEVAGADKEVWARFYGTGFWRSPSQREDAAWGSPPAVAVS